MKKGLQGELYHLHTMTLSVIRRAIELANQDKKDIARDWYRYVEQTEILKILQCGGWDVQLHRDGMLLLKDLCHPLTEPSYRTDTERILAAIEEVKNFNKRSPALFVERFNLAGQKN
jgi:HD superfamily phosphohydrolase YqeK